jgi:hypothetical protein
MTRMQAVIIGVIILLVAFTIFGLMATGFGSGG